MAMEDVPAVGVRDVVRSGARHVEVDEFHALAVGGQLDLAFRGGDDAGDGFDVRSRA